MQQHLVITNRYKDKFWTGVMCIELGKDVWNMRFTADISAAQQFATLADAEAAVRHVIAKYGVLQEDIYFVATAATQNAAPYRDGFILEDNRAAGLYAASGVVDAANERLKKKRSITEILKRADESHTDDWFLESLLRELQCFKDCYTVAEIAFATEHIGDYIEAAYTKRNVARFLADD